jgi:hypothetical protein
LSIKDYTVWADRLDTLHEMRTAFDPESKVNIFVHDVQLPEESNGMEAIMHARVETPWGTFTDYGDANPKNVGKAIIPHIIRMASTRAKARAVGMAINEGKPAWEEIVGPAEEPSQAAQERGRAMEAKPPLRAVEEPIGPETQKRLVKAISDVAAAANKERQEVMGRFMAYINDKYGAPGIAQLTEEQATRAADNYERQLEEIRSQDG